MNTALKYNSQFILLHFFWLIFIHLFTSNAYSQGFDVTPLNRHFYSTLSMRDPNTVYSQMKSYNEDGSTFTQITDLQNRVVKTIQEGKNPHNGSLEIVESLFDTDGNLIMRSEENSDRSRKFIFYYEDGAQVAHVEVLGNNDFEIWRMYASNRYKSTRNDFKPSLFPNDKDWKKFVLKEKRFLAEAQKQGIEGTVILAFLIDKNGQRIKTEVANFNELPNILTSEALRIGELFVGNYNPAINHKGETIEAWLYLPVGFYFYR